jgi:cobalt/nickel transport system permease protein
MHMADALLSPAVGGAMWLASGAALAFAARRVQTSAREERVPLMGVLGAFVFAAQMINFAIPGTGSSGHLGGGLLLAILLGPHAALIVIASVLAVQALLFADGGLLAFGANVLNVGVVPCLLTYPLVYRPLAGADPTSRRAAVATVVAAVIALQLGALGVVVQTSASGIASLPAPAFLALMLPIHLAIGLIEGFATVAIVRFIARVQPELLGERETAAARRRPLAIAAPVAIAAALIAGGLSWFASDRPDGLEWSIAHAAEAPIAVPANGVHQMAAGVQARTALAPEYSIAAVPERAGTSLAGLAGGAITLLLIAGVAVLLRRR